MFLKAIRPTRRRSRPTSIFDESEGDGGHVHDPRPFGAEKFRISVRKRQLARKAARAAHSLRAGESCGKKSAKDERARGGEKVFDGLAAGARCRLSADGNEGRRGLDGTLTDRDIT